jgi:cytochrome c oxidase cbb3-type subunit 3
MAVLLRCVAAAGLAGLVFLALDGGGSEAAAPTTPADVFRTSCLECHDGDGRGEASRDLLPKIPDFTDPRWQASRSDAELTRSILEGKGKSMPRMRKKLGSVDVRQMVALVRSFQGGRQVVSSEPEPLSPTPTPTLRPAAPLSPRDLSRSEGKQLFQRFCVRCHGADGTGSGSRDSLPALPDFTGRAWQASRSDPQLAAIILAGKGTGMPAFRAKLGREQARDLAAFIRTFVPSFTPPPELPPDDFDARFQQLVQEVEDLGRQVRALSAAGRK